MFHNAGCLLPFWLLQTLWRIWIMGLVYVLSQQSSHIPLVCTLALWLVDILGCIQCFYCRLVDHGKLCPLRQRYLAFKRVQCAWRQSTNHTLRCLSVCKFFRLFFVFCTFLKINTSPHPRFYPLLPNS